MPLILYNEKPRAVRYEQFDNKLEEIPPSFGGRKFIRSIIGDVIVVTTYRDNIDGLRYKALGIITNNRHYEVKQ